MLPNIVGPQAVGATDLKSMLGKGSEKDQFQGAKEFKDSEKALPFQKTLQDKITDKSQEKGKNLRKSDAKEDQGDSKEQISKDSKNREVSKERTRDKREHKMANDTESKVANTNAVKKNKTANRQDAINEFMDSFESEFQISPTRLVEAMAKLDEDQLKLSPEETADSVIDLLDLSEDQAEKARSMYAALLVQLQQTPEKQIMTPSEEKTGLSFMSSPAVNRFEDIHDKQNKMLSEIDSLNKKNGLKTDKASNINAKIQAYTDQFEVNPEVIAEKDVNLDVNSEINADFKTSVEPGIKEAPGGENIKESNPGDLSKLQNFEISSEGKDVNNLTTLKENIVQKESSEKPSEKFQLPPHLLGQMKEIASPEMLAALAEKNAQKSLMANSDQAALNVVEKSVDNGSALIGESDSGREAETDQLEDLINKFQETIDSLTGSSTGKEENIKNDMGSENSKGFMQGDEQSPSESFLKNSKEFNHQDMSQDRSSDKSEDKEKSTQFKSSLKGLEGIASHTQKLESLKSDNLNAPGALPIHVGSTERTENQAAVKQLMNQAQFLIKKGGGEVKVEMSPGDMGTVHLKVMLKDGKVNLEMAAQTPEAKNTIESSLAELKNSLAAHKLSVENVKIDVVSSASADTATRNQMQNNGGGQEQRDQSRHFWNQFNDNFGNQNRRESFTEFQNFKGYNGAKKEREPLKPIDASRTMNVREVSGNRGRGLNLVA